MDGTCGDYDQMEEDPFVTHFEQNISLPREWKKEEKHVTLASLGRVKYTYYPEVKNVDLSNSIDANLYRIKPIEKLSSLQSDLLTLIYNYVDVFYPMQDINTLDLQLVYCLHILNHVLKSNSKIVHHNNKLKKRSDIPDEFRDQGLTSPKVLVIVPFRNVALEIVSTLISLLGDEANIMNKKRFYTDYGYEESDKPKLKRPDDYEKMFAGNIDDSFRIGISIKKKYMKLFAEFYSADVIIASPLGLRTIIGAEGEKDRDYDFLSSIEILIFDKCDVFLMQNWEHVIHLMKHLNLQLQKSHDCDYFRVRMWCLDGLSKFYRQTILLSQVITPHLLSLFNKHCFNYAGKIIVKNQIFHGSISKILVQLPQVFQQFDASSYQSASDERFSFFISKILPQFKDSSMSHILIFIPFYWDFVRLRNYFKKEELSFTQLCEYSSNEKIAKARNIFYRGIRKFVLCTERFHFFKRYQIKGIQHIIFYQLPIYPHFYSEFCNFMHRSMQSKSQSLQNTTCTVLYSKYDSLQLSAILGDDKTSYLLSADKKVHMYVSGN
ncbi:digestive organ expansion factor homolog [Centruroides sculpturatus]|uniref:digestive organ expansion factor homolog n=1 Tax=Centruroides sculpturatus TaxID=218467 RepID=UPI000C6EC0FB|nr:digestive organ expansion factor homolog [Centruroides sculpturatus]